MNLLHLDGEKEYIYVTTKIFFDSGFIQRDHPRHWSVTKGLRYRSQIFLIFCMKVGLHKGTKSTERDFRIERSQNGEKTYLLI